VVVKRIILTIGILCVALAMIIDVAAMLRAVGVKEALTAISGSRVYLTLLSSAGWIMIIASLALMLIEAFRHSRMATGRTNAAISTAADSDVSSGSSD
jgi:hypothetical protein